MDAELRAILVEHELEYGAWRLEEVDILTKADLPKLWKNGEDFFGSEGYSQNTLEIFKKKLCKYAP